MGAASLLDGGAHAVIGNPPYIVCSDPEKRAAYRRRYVSASRNFGLGAPFTERLYQLCSPEGFLAQITSNAFMKREYGKALVEKVLPRVCITHVLDTSGCFIPGHGTPTVILAGRGYAIPSPARVCAVRGKRGAPSTPPSGRPCAVWESFGPSRRRLHPLLGTATDFPLEGARLAKDIERAWKRRTGTKLPPSLVPWFVATATLYAWEARGLLARRAEPLEDALLRLDAQLALLDDRADEAGRWLEELVRSGITPALGVAVREVFDGLCPPEGPEATPSWATLDTDWLGDFYQALDARARDEDALGQTPWWIRDALLDLTLDPAVRRFGLEGLRVLDPACGSGHLLLGAFWRLFEANARAGRGTAVECATVALASCEGVELTGQTAWLARMRLTLAWLDATAPVGRAPRERSAWDAPATRVEVGDALLEGVVCPSPPRGAEGAPGVLSGEPLLPLAPAGVAVAPPPRELVGV